MSEKLRRPGIVQVNLRVSEKLHHAIVAEARRNKRSANAEMRDQLERSLKQDAIARALSRLDVSDLTPGKMMELENE